MSDRIGLSGVGV